MKKRIALLLLPLFTMTFLTTDAEEGMWIPALLGQLNIGQMQSLGFKLSAEDIYSINHSSMKDGIVQFGRGCTGVLVSRDGLLLTNHHCGYGSIQNHSTLDHDYLAEGFWAGNREEELPNPGLTVTFLVRMEDVTGLVLNGVNSRMTLAERSALIKKNSESVERGAKKESWQEARIRPFFYGNVYYLLVTATYRDVRLAGAPPSSIGKFGGDTDNWVWPRHTGDFSVFRIYAGKDNRPADYAPENVPYRPDYFFPVSLKGYDQGDFTLVFGFPGTTREYIPSWGVSLIAFTENPVKISLREKRLQIIQSSMDTSHLVRIQYASKSAGIANYWKKMIGETRGVARLHEVEARQEEEQQFASWVAADAVRREKYQGLLDQFQSAYTAYAPVSMASAYLTEAGMAPELVRFAAGFDGLIRLSQKKDGTPDELRKEADKITAYARSFFRNYQPSIDRQIMMAMLPAMQQGMPSGYLPGIFHQIDTKYKGNAGEYSSALYGRTIFADSSHLVALLARCKPSEITRMGRDPGFDFAMSVTDRYNKDILPLSTKYISTIDSLQRIYMEGLVEMEKDRKFYPDANSTLRVSYGKVDGYSPTDAVEFNYFTTSEGILQKEDPTIYDYTVDKKLKALLVNKEFGRYADRDGSLHVAFIASNHTSGGNSGSPVINAQGQLIGLNFDRNWEGTMSDLVYDPGQCRNITLDIRYCLFVIDKYAGARRLVDEMTLVE